MTPFVLEPLNPLGKAGLGWIRCVMLVNTCPPSSLSPSHSDFASVPVCSLHGNYKCSKNKKTISEIYFD